MNVQYARKTVGKQGSTEGKMAKETVNRKGELSVEHLRFQGSK